MTKVTISRLFAGVSLLATVGFTTVTARDTKTLCKGFLPENTMNIPVSALKMRQGGLTEQQFNEILDRLERVFHDDVASVGDRLTIRRNWTDGTVNASAMKAGNTEILNMYGGLARHPAITAEGF